MKEFSNPHETPRSFAEQIKACENLKQLIIALENSTILDGVIEIVKSFATGDLDDFGMRIRGVPEEAGIREKVKELVFKRDIERAETPEAFLGCFDNLNLYSIESITGSKGNSYEILDVKAAIVDYFNGGQANTLPRWGGIRANAVRIRDGQ